MRRCSCSPLEVAIPYAGPAGTVAFRTTDAPGSWSVGLVDGDFPITEVGPPQGDAEVEIEGRAEDVALFLWGRLDRGSLEIRGDDLTADAYLGWLD